MADPVEKNIQIKNLTGDLLFPKTKAAVVFNNDGKDLGTVEQGAQVNILEGIKIDGVELTINNKIAEYTTPDAVEYTIVKAGTADDGYAATYQLAADGVAFGTKINIPKDMVVSGGQLKKCAEANNPVEGLAVGDPYIELTIANNDGTKLYIPVKDLVDIYTADETYIKLEDGEFSLDLDQVKADIQDTFYTETEVDALILPSTQHIANGDLHVTKAQKEGWDKGIADNAEAIETLDGEVVKLAGDQTIEGTKTFSASPIVPTATAGDSSTKAASTAFVAGALGTLDAGLVHLAGAETITGAKDFQAGLTNSSTIAANDNTTQVATTAWVNAAIAEAIKNLITYDVLA